MIIEGSQTIEIVKARDGTEAKQLTLNPKKIWYKTHIINAPTFGRYSLYKEILESKAEQCFYHMSHERAQQLANELLSLCGCYDYSIDAKSSECLRDKNNTQSTLIDKINRNKIERQYTIKDELKKGLFDGFLGKKTNQDIQQD